MLGSSLLTALARAIHACQEVGAPFALGGGLAATVRGRLRSTRDCDLLIHADQAQMVLLIETLRQSGFSHMDRADRHRLDDVTLYRFWFPVEGSEFSLSLDVQVGLQEFHRQTLERATRESLGDVTMPVATLEDLILMKLAAWRPIDRADAIDLLSLAPTCDLAFIERWVGRMGLQERWDEIKSDAQK